MRISKKFDGGQGGGEGDAFLAFLQAVEDSEGRMPIRPAMVSPWLQRPQSLCCL